ncbi:hypothetical protein HN954_00785 [bacterium]|jgi:hypothetical protein|nr:hypothetical protein [bacterium]MBT6831570.1 hypothetical protein [bacterium]MBT6995949.1 hypothetical protein [bacterium]MBT7772394.1 hypothetical protein [bacterium]
MPEIFEKRKRENLKKVAAEIVDEEKFQLFHLSAALDNKKNRMSLRFEVEKKSDEKKNRNRQILRKKTPEVSQESKIEK